MSEPKRDLVESPEQAAESGTLAARLSLSQRAGGVAVPVATVVLAFLIGCLVVLATGHNPLDAYRDIFNGAGLNWFFHPTTSTQGAAAYNLYQTLLQSTTLILTGHTPDVLNLDSYANFAGDGSLLPAKDVLSSATRRDFVPIFARNGQVHGEPAVV